MAEKKKKKKKKKKKDCQTCIKYHLHWETTSVYRPGKNVTQGCEIIEFYYVSN